MNPEINKLIEDFSKAKTVDSKIALVRQHMHNSHFCWLLQKTYGLANVYESIDTSSIDSSIVEKTEIVSGLALPMNGDVKIKDVIEFLLNDRRTFGGKSNLVMARCNTIPMKYGNVLNKIVDGTLFGLSRSIINEAFGFSFLPETKCFATTDFRKDFYEKGKNWKCIQKNEGSLISILIVGNSVEVYSKQGKVYRIFDKLRKLFSKIPVDGMFQCQLYYTNENGRPDQNRFLQETAKKSQSEDFLCDVFDFVPLTCLSGVSNGKKYSDRYLTASFLISRFVDDDSGVYVTSLRDFDLKNPPQCECYVVDMDKEFGKTKPKNFMTWKIKENKEK